MSERMGEWSGVEWSGYPLDCYDYQSTCGANKKKIVNTKKDEEREKWEIVQKRSRRSGRAGDRRKLLPDTLFFSTIQEQNEEKNVTNNYKTT